MLPHVWMVYIPLPPLFFLSPLHRIPLALFLILHIFLIAFLPLRIPFYSSEDQHSTTSSFQENLDAITRFSSFRELATLYYGDGPMTSSSIVSSIEFDKDGEFFAVGGVTRKIKVCD